jgi:DNA-binding transcriptional regulator YiaG
LSKFATTLKDEITRLGRKEAKRPALPLKQRIAAPERLFRQQRLAMTQLSRQAVAASKAVVATPEAAPNADGDQSRLGPRSIKSQRKRLRLSQMEFAKLAGVTHVCVYLWESGKTKRRGRNRESLLKLRTIGVRDARRQLDGAVPSKPSRAPRPRAQPSATRQGGGGYRRAIASQALRRRRRA